MRVILAEGQFDTRGVPPKWEGGVLYRCRDDLTCGPVSAWPDRAAFQSARAEWWLGLQYDALTADWTGEDFLRPWSPVYPNTAFEVWAELSTEENARWEAFADFDATCANATSFEVWHHDTLQGRVFLAFALAEIGLVAPGVPVHDKCFPFAVKTEAEQATVRAALAAGPVVPMTPEDCTRLVQV